MDRLRTVVTGVGAVCSLGPNVNAFWQGLMGRACGLRPLTRFDTASHRITRGGEVEGFDLDPERDEAIQFAEAAAREAVASAGLDAGALKRAAVVLGTNFGAMSSLDRFLRDPSAADAGDRFRESALHGPTEAVARAVGAGGARQSLSLSCASGAGAVFVALQALRSGVADVVLAGGYDAINELSWSGLTAIRTMTNDVLRPFDVRRNGTIFSEGAGVLIIETLDSARRRGATPLAEVLGAATDNNAYHMAHPDPGGAGMARVMAAALVDAGVAPEEIAYASAHGTGTKYNDKLETLALKTVLGGRARQIPVVSIKSSVGHGMGAASALEAIATVRAIREGRAPATIHLEEPDPECDLDYVPDGPRDVDIRTALCNSAGIGGPNAALVLRRWEEEA